MPATTFRLAALIATLAGLASPLAAQINFQVSEVSVDPAATGDTFEFNLTLHGTTKTEVTAAPFQIDHQPFEGSMHWFCLAPLKPMYHSGHLAYSDFTYTYTSTAFADFIDATAPGTNTIGAAAAAVRADYLATLFTQNSPYTTNANTLAAIQLAVWEIANETSGSFNLAGGVFSSITPPVTNAGATAILAQAQIMLNNVALAASSGNTSRLSYLINVSATGDDPFTAQDPDILQAQDLVGFFPPIPESSHYAIGASALMVFGILWRRRQQKQVAA
ncbi:MAG: hypothetical protein V4773_18020 [Verrucomicrobiota bacterium]